MAEKAKKVEFHAVDRSKIRNKIFRMMLVPYKSKSDEMNKVLLISAKTGLPLFHMGINPEKGVTLSTTVEEVAWENTKAKAVEVEA